MDRRDYHVSELYKDHGEKLSKMIGQCLVLEVFAIEYCYYCYVIYYCYFVICYYHVSYLFIYSF